MKQCTYDSVWDNDIYGRRQHFNRYPFDSVVTFIFRHYPRTKPRGVVRILEVGCGAGNNLWFAAREGFRVNGLDGSASAIAYAQRRFTEENLQGEFIVGNFTELPYADELFDLVVDRAALTCCGWTAVSRALAEVHRMLRPGGVLFFNPYHERHSSQASGQPGADRVRIGISEGTLKNVGQIFFYNRAQIDELFAAGWSIRMLQSMEMVDENAVVREIHAEWRVIAEKQ